MLFYVCHKFTSAHEITHANKRLLKIRGGTLGQFETKFKLHWPVQSIDVKANTFRPARYRLMKHLITLERQWVIP